MPGRSIPANWFKFCPKSELRFVLLYTAEIEGGFWRRGSRAREVMRVLEAGG